MYRHLSDASDASLFIYYPWYLTLWFSSLHDIDCSHPTRTTFPSLLSPSTNVSWLCHFEFLFVLKLPSFLVARGIFATKGAGAVAADKNASWSLSTTWSTYSGKQYLLFQWHLKAKRVLGLLWRIEKSGLTEALGSERYWQTVELIRVERRGI